MTSLVAGVDVGAHRIHAVILDQSMQLVESALFRTDGLEIAADWLARCAVVAIDSPDRPSTGARPEHADLGLKFQTGRCAEVGLGRQYKVWVPWVTPTESTFGGWMAHGSRLFELLKARAKPIEVYPYAVFRALASFRPLPPKSRLEGVKARIALLRSRGITERDLEMWSHDGLDSLAAAIVAMDWLGGAAREATCGHDGSAMWLPSAPAVAAQVGAIAT